MALDHLRAKGHPTSPTWKKDHQQAAAVLKISGRGREKNTQATFCIRRVGWFQVLVGMCLDFLASLLIVQIHRMVMVPLSTHYHHQPHQLVAGIPMTWLVQLDYWGNDYYLFFQFQPITRIVKKLKLAHNEILLCTSNRRPQTFCSSKHMFYSPTICILSLSLLYFSEKRVVAIQ